MKDEIRKQLIALHNDESGATATEYIILLVLVACFVIGVVRLFGSTLSSKFQASQKALDEQVVFGS